jgi:hypothetical protein
MPTLRLHREGQPPIEVQAPRALLGRDKSCEIVVEDRSISRRHVAFELREQAWALVDQGSANGTFVEGRRVSEVTLADGQAIRLGSLAFRVEIEPDVAQTVLLPSPDLDENATVVMSSPEAPPVVGTVQIQVPSLAPPVVRPAATPARPPEPPPRPPARAAEPPRPAARGEADPWQLLGLPPGSSPAAIGARYEESARDLQLKIAHAPTPALRVTYEKNLAALERARQQLAPASPPSAADAEDLARDLPSAQPSVDADLLEQMEESRRAAAESEPPPLEAAPARGRSSLLPAATSALVFSAAGLLALCSFFALASAKLRQQIHKAEEAPELVAARQAAAKYAAFEGLLKSGALRNGRLRLCNRSSRPLEITWLAAVYAQKDDLPAEADLELAKRASGFKLATYNSGFCAHDFRISLPPGAEQAVELRSEDPRCRFDGHALFYALSLQRPAAPEPSPAPPAKAKGPQVEAPEHPGDPGTTYWLSGLLGGQDQCVSVGAGW